MHIIFRKHISAIPLVVLISFPVILFAQSLPDSMISKIDNLFKQWDNPNTPGCAIAIIRNDSILYKKGYGSANLEYGIPISPETIFHMASVSKQFTAFSIVLLEKQGKLKLDDDIRKYLSWFPDMGKKITIRHLLNHTSGVRDQWQLLAISGTRLDDVITQEHIVKILSKQKELNFQPGEQFLYSNSGFTMLAEIVKAVTGQTLRAFTDSAIFRPLGMTNTHFHDNYEEIEKNRSYSYGRIDSTHFSNSILSYSNAGATSLFTNIDDMALWVMNFYNHKVGNQKDIDRLTEKGKLNTGKETDYALGISSDKQFGWRRFSHSGGDAGYRTFIAVFPDLKIGFLVFSNLGDFNPYFKAFELSRLFISDTSKKVAVVTQKKDSSLAVLKNAQSWKKFTGDFIADDGTRLNFKIKNDKLYGSPAGDQDYLLMKQVADTFAAFLFPELKLVFSEKANRPVVDFIDQRGQVHRMAPFTLNTTFTDKQMEAYTGEYYCAELDCKYGIVLRDHELYLTNNKYNDAKLKLVGEDHMTDDFWWMSHLLIKRDGAKKITGFEVNDGRVMHLRFNKIK
jgi:CubicO group peptidase (beta-lactamase class C family)